MEGAPHAEGTFYGQNTLVECDEPAGDGEPEPYSIGVLLVVVNSHKWFKYPILMGGLNPCTSVWHRYGT
jgi:hypothetical protein